MNIHFTTQLVSHTYFKCHSLVGKLQSANSRSLNYSHHMSNIHGIPFGNILHHESFPLCTQFFFPYLSVACRSIMINKYRTLNHMIYEHIFDVSCSKSIYSPIANYIFVVLHYQKLFLLTEHLNVHKAVELVK